MYVLVLYRTIPCGTITLPTIPYGGIDANMNECIHEDTYMWTCVQAYLLTRMHVCAQACLHAAYTQIHIRKYTHASERACLRPRLAQSPCRSLKMHVLVASAPCSERLQHQASSSFAESSATLPSWGPNSCLRFSQRVHFYNVFINESSMFEILGSGFLLRTISSTTCW